MKLLRGSGDAHALLYPARRECPRGAREKSESVCVFDECVGGEGEDGGRGEVERSTSSKMSVSRRVRNFDIMQQQLPRASPTLLLRGSEE